MKATTIEQYKTLQFIKDNFNIETLQLTLIYRYTIEIKDCNEDIIQFRYVNGKII